MKCSLYNSVLLWINRLRQRLRFPAVVVIEDDDACVFGGRNDSSWRVVPVTAHKRIRVKNLAIFFVSEDHSAHTFGYNLNDGNGVKAFFFNSIFLLLFLQVLLLKMLSKRLVHFSSLF